ncbi:MAG TPA: ribonuclease catalytic domain-containing protein, partial [Nitrospirota bacterium]|nr:ribonuclease catalytic domain-containing protein [Nitrospirota bacterium]
MSNTSDKQSRALLQRIARQAMVERGLLPDFSPQALFELDDLNRPATKTDTATRDLRELPWCSIDNDDSRDLDQLTVAENMPDGSVKVLVAVADVDALVKKDSAIDDHAGRNTTSVYTAARIFPMLPEKLSTDLTSLNFESERLALIVELIVGAEGALLRFDVYEALVRNHAKLAYNNVASWLEGIGAIPPGIRAIPGLDDNLRIQDRVAQRMKRLRHEHGALTLETVETRLVFDVDELTDLQAERKNRAKDIIEDFMIAANGATARFLSARGLPSFRRVVRTPKRWDRIAELAEDHGHILPDAPDAKALEAFLIQAKAGDPLRFPDLSLAIIKLLGAGEYVLDVSGGST